MAITLKGMAALETRFNSVVSRAEKRIIDTRKRVAAELLDTIISATSVWSGRVVRSIEVSNSPTGGNSQEPHPDRGDFSHDGRWDAHPEWKGESQRDSAESIAKATVETTNYGLTEKVFITSNAVIWDEMNTKQHPYSNPVRQKPVISEIAIESIRALFKGIVK